MRRRWSLAVVAAVIVCGVLVSDPSAGDAPKPFGDSIADVNRTKNMRVAKRIDIPNVNGDIQGSVSIVNFHELGFTEFHKTTVRVFVRGHDPADATKFIFDARDRLSVFFNGKSRVDFELVRRGLAVVFQFHANTFPSAPWVGEPVSGSPLDCVEINVSSKLSALSGAPFFVKFAFSDNARAVSNMLLAASILRDCVGLAHGFSGKPRVFNSFAGKDDLFVKKDGSDSRGQDGKERDYYHPEGPKRRGLLGGEIALFVILACSGLGVCYHSFDRAGKSRDIWQTLGWASIVVMAALVASYSLILLMVGSV